MRSLYFLLFAVFVAGCASTQERYLKAHPDMTEDQAHALLNKSVTYGLDKEAVRTSLGVPKKMFGYLNEGKQMEVWVYSEFEWHPYENVMFENGKVISWNFPKSVKRELEDRAAKELLSGERALPEQLNEDKS